MSARPAVFLDRDGTMIHDPGYLGRLEGLQWYPYAVDAVRLLNRAGFLVFVTTNQGGVGLGLFDEDFVRTVHETMTARLEAAGARIDGWFYCLHHPRAVIEALRMACDCRKPRPGMIRQAQQRFDIDLPRSFVVGDKLSDVGLGHSVAAKSVLVRTGHGENELALLAAADGAPSFVAPDLIGAVSWILHESGHPQSIAGSAGHEQAERHERV
jgi:D-glycero-D-manno-heptose 1,7-bisphosphate phosphatase